MRESRSAFRLNSVASCHMTSELTAATRASDLVSYDEWLNQLSITHATGWRWRKRGGSNRKYLRAGLCFAICHC